MLRSLFVAATMLVFGAADLSSAIAQTPSASNTLAQKTSDRTPGNVAPERTPGASRTGAAGTEAGQTVYGTSDRTPSKHYQTPSN
jgi:hypothetical protein